VARPVLRRAFGAALATAGAQAVTPKGGHRTPSSLASLLRPPAERSGDRFGNLEPAQLRRCAEVDLPRFSGQVDYAASAFTRMTASYFIGLFPASAV